MTHAILQAASFAAENMRRKAEGVRQEPYINHLLEVAELVSSVAEQDENLIVAGLLHDTVEDAGVSLAQLSERFGDDVAALVAEVTDDKSLPKAERKRLQIVNAPHKSPRAQIIKLADKISNLRSMLYSPPADWSDERRREYFDWASQVAAGLTAPNAQLKREFDQLVGEFDTTLVRS